MPYKSSKCARQSRELFSSNQDVIGAGLTNASAFKMADVIHTRDPTYNLRQRQKRLFFSRIIVLRQSKMKK